MGWPLLEKNPFPPLAQSYDAFCLHYLILVSTLPKMERGLREFQGRQSDQELELNGDPSEQGDFLG